VPDPIWTKTKAELVIEIMHEQFGPKSRWEFATVPARTGTETRAKFDRTVELLAEIIGCAPGGVRMTLDAVRGHQFRNDPHVRKWVYVIVAKALEIGFITPEEAPPIAAADDGGPGDEQD
jgi:hypothetical protein